MTRYYAVYAKRPGRYNPMCFSTSIWRDSALFTARSLLDLGIPAFLQEVMEVGAEIQPRGAYKLKKLV